MTFLYYNYLRAFYHFQNVASAAIFDDIYEATLFPNLDLLLM